MLGQEIYSCGATRLDENRPLNAYNHMLTFFDGESGSGAHTKNKFVLIALESPFGFIFYTAITPPAVLSYKSDKTYLLFLNGLIDYIIIIIICQDYIAKLFVNFMRLRNKYIARTK